MKQEEAVEKILTVLLREEKITVDQVGVLAPFFLQAYGAGFDVGRTMHIRKKPVVQLSMFGEKLAVFESTTSAARRVRLSHSDICRVARGERRTAGGYKWKYLDEYKP